jgi:hypothetical protein
MIFLSCFNGPSSQDQQKTLGRRLLTSKVTLTGQFMVIFVLRKVTLPNRTLRTMNERSHTNFVP